MMSENLDDLKERFQKWRSALEGKGMKVNVGKTKIMVSGTERENVLSKMDPCGICGKRVWSNLQSTKICSHNHSSKIKCSYTSHKFVLQ